MNENENQNLTTPDQPENSAAGPEPSATDTPVQPTEAAPQAEQPAADVPAAPQQPVEAPAEEAAEPAQPEQPAEPEVTAEAPAQPAEPAAGEPEQPAAVAQEPFPQQPTVPYQNPNPQPQAYAYEAATDGAGAAVAKKNKTPIIIGIVVLVIVGLIIAAFALGGGGGSKSGGEMKLVSVPSRSKDPEGYLNAVVHNSQVNMLQGSSVLDLDRFSGKAVAHDFSMSFNLSDFSYYAPDSKMAVNTTVKYGAKQQRMLVDVGITTMGMTIAGNQLYVTPDLIAFKIPMLVSRYDYVTIDTSTFEEDYEDSIFYSPYSQLPSDFDLKKSIEEMFNPPDVNDPVTQGFADNMAGHMEKFQKTRTFEDKGTFTETINGKTMDVSRMSYTYKADDVEQMYEDILDELEAFLEAELQMAEIAGSGTYYQSDIDYLMDALDSIEFTGDVVITYTIDENDQIIRIETNRIEMTVYEEYWDRYSEFEITFELDLAGEKKAGDKVNMVMEIYSVDYDEAVELRFSAANNDSDDMISRSYQLDFDAGKYDDYSVNLDLEWRPKEDGKNMRLTLEMVDHYFEEPFGIRITGNMVNDKDEFSINNGQFVVYDDNYTEFGFEFAYKLYEIAASELELDISKGDNVSFADLRERDFTFY